MKIYETKKRFFVSPLERYLPEGAIVARYESVTRIVIVDEPRSDLDPFNTLVDGFEYSDPEQVTWIYELEPPPLGTNNVFFTLIASKYEDEFGNVGGSGDGLPDVSHLRIDTVTGVPYVFNADTNLYYPLRVTGPDGNVYLEIGQNGVAKSAINGAT